MATEKHSSTISAKNGDGVNMSITVSASDRRALDANLEVAKAFLASFVTGNQREIEFDGGMVLRGEELRADKRLDNGMQEFVVVCSGVSEEDGDTLQFLTTQKKKVEVKVVQIPEPSKVSVEEN